MLDTVTEQLTLHKLENQDETKQGEAYAPFPGDPNAYLKRFYMKAMAAR